MNRITVPSRFGPLTLTEERGVIARLDWAALPGEPTPLLEEAARQLPPISTGNCGSSTCRSTGAAA